MIPRLISQLMTKSYLMSVQPFLKLTTSGVDPYNLVVNGSTTTISSTNLQLVTNLYSSNRSRFKCGWWYNCSRRFKCRSGSFIMIQHQIDGLCGKDIKRTESNTIGKCGRLKNSVTMTNL